MDLRVKLRSHGQMLEISDALIAKYQVINRLKTDTDKISYPDTFRTNLE